MPDSQTHCFHDILMLLHTDTPVDQVESVVATYDTAQSWKAFLDESGMQGVTPLLYSALKPYRQQIPPEVWYQIAKTNFYMAAINTLLLGEWAAVVQCLGEHNIETLVLKGAALADALYGNIALRPMQDLDLLLQQKQVDAAREALSVRGYVQVKEEHFAGSAPRFESQVSLARRDDVAGLTYVCELHWHLLDSPFYQRTISLDWFWDTAAPLQLENVTTKTLGLEARLLHLCSHLALHHHGQRLLWYCDIDRLLRSYGEQLDWDIVITHAQAYRLVLSLRTVLAQTVDWLGSPLPEEVMAQIATLQPDLQESKVFDFMVIPSHGVIERFVSDLSQLAGMPEKLRFIFANIFPSPAYMRQRYQLEHNGQLLPSYFYRLVKGVWDGMKMLFAHWLRDLRTDI